MKRVITVLLGIIFVFLGVAFIGLAASNVSKTLDVLGQSPTMGFIGIILLCLAFIIGVIIISAGWETIQKRSISKIFSE